MMHRCTKLDTCKLFYPAVMSESCHSQFYVYLSVLLHHGLTASLLFDSKLMRCKTLDPSTSEDFCSTSEGLLCKNGFEIFLTITMQ